MSDAEKLDLGKVNQQIEETVMHLRKLVNYRYDLLIYRLIKRGRINITDLSEDSGLSRTSIYKLVDDFDAEIEKAVREAANS